MDNWIRDQNYSLIKQEAAIIDGAFQMTKFCLYQCNNDSIGKCFENCNDKWHNSRLLAQKLVSEILEKSIK